VISKWWLHLNNRSVMLRIFVLLGLFTAACSAKSKAQVILNGDGTPLKTDYCWEDKNYKIIGQPVGGIFSGCGVFQQGGDWYFNPVTASQSVTVFPFQCSISYTVNGHPANEPVTIEKPIRVATPLIDTSTCSGDFYLHTGMMYAGDYVYRWTPANFLTDPNKQNTAGHITQTQVFVLTTTDISNGCVGKDSLTVVRSPQPVLQITPDTTIFARATVHLRASGAHSYIWSPTTWLDNPFSATPVAMPHDAITYTVTGINEYGCSDTAQVHINIIANMFLPDAFTPNGDGLNDVFRVVNFGYEAIQDFSIFNRWGQRVFYTHDGTSGWDGTFNGKPAEGGVYFYVIQIGMLDGTQKKFQGDVTLIR
jgi:gliding motility-associated-like protein